VNKRDYLTLKKIQAVQGELSQALNDLRISQPADLDSINPIMRRGLVHAVSDMFEMSVILNQDVLDQIPFDKVTIKRFRNSASHKYGQITNSLAYACITHCVNKPLIKTINALISAYEKKNEG